ncbi:MAG: hypothetical protein RMJ67_01215 [Elusimicrobiota bacterium]|nr:hypothetical protein [Endomicrobiia bacterium]MDW8165123.1 hypothetical protein [Elusimicrobiota bacterium]
MEQYKIFEMLYRYFSNRAIEQGETALYKVSDGNYVLCEIVKVEDPEKRIYLVKLLDTYEIVRTNKVIPMWTSTELEELLRKMFTFINKTTNRSIDVLLQRVSFLLSNKKTYTAVLIENDKPIDEMFVAESYDVLLASIVLKIVEFIYSNKEVKSAISI